MRGTNRDLTERIGELEKRVTNLQMLLMSKKARIEDQLPRAGVPALRNGTSDLD